MNLLTSSVRPEAEPLAVDAQTAAKMLGGISPRSLWSLKASGALPCVRVGRRVLYRVADLHEFLASRVAKEGSANV